MTNIDNLIYCMGEKLIKKKKKTEILNCYGKLIINDHSIHCLNFIFVKQFMISNELDFYYLTILEILKGLLKVKEFIFKKKKKLLIKIFWTYF